MKLGKILVIQNTIIILLLGVVLFFTFKNIDSSKSENISTKNDNKTIINIIPEAELNDFAETLIKFTNSSDSTAVYNLFSEWTKNQLSENEINETVIKINNLTGKANNIYYSYNEYKGFSKGADWYNVFYKCDFDNGQGTVRLSYRIIDGRNEFIGFHYNIDEIK